MSHSTTAFLRDEAALAEIDIASGYAKYVLTDGESSLKPEKDLGSRKDAERAFLQSFWKFCAVEELTNAKPIFLHSASVALGVAFDCLKERGIKKIGLLTPLLDIIPTKLRKDGFDLEPLSEKEFHSGAYAEKKWEAHKSAILLAMPNNPTGCFLNAGELVKLGKFCKEKDIVLVLDSSFRPFAPGAGENDVEILRKTGCSFIVVYDTGKTISANGKKAGFIFCSEDLYDDIQTEAEFYGSVEKSRLLELRDAAESLLRQGGRDKVVSIVEDNRTRLASWLQGTDLRLMPAESPSSVAWIRLPKKWHSDLFVKALIKKENVAVTPGDPFFWDSDSDGPSPPPPYIRVSLARDTTYFETGAARLARFANAYTPMS
jgi:aspartate/methionine/tyrosine aminotransferase